MPVIKLAKYLNKYRDIQLVNQRVGQTERQIGGGKHTENIQTDSDADKKEKYRKQANIYK